METEAKQNKLSISDLDPDITELKVEIEEFIKETEKIHHDFLETVNNINNEFRSVDSIFAKHRYLGFCLFCIDLT